MSTFLEIEDLYLDYSKQKVLNGIDFSVSQGELICLIGPSGCGKTSFLRAIAGFEQPSSGEIRLDNKQIFSNAEHVEPERRGIGFVFQDLALFPHLNVYENLSFGLKRLGDEERKARVEQILKAIGLEEFRNRYPHELSGGQKQRVALGRSIAPAPKLLLLDEPFSSLDPETAESMALELRTLLKHFQLTAIMVTHNQNEAFSLADNIAVMQNGKITHFSDPESLYSFPPSLAVAKFIGDGFWLEAKVENESITTEVGSIEISSKSRDTDSVRNGKLFLRPDAIAVCDSTSEGYDVTVLNLRFRGNRYIAQAETALGQKILVSLRGIKPKLGQVIRIQVKKNVKYVLYPE